jgi:ankyrin repeat protein
MPMSPGERFEKINGRQTEPVLRALAAQPALAAARDTYLGSTPLYFAAHRGLQEIVAALLAAGADIHARETASDSTPLRWAAEGGHTAIARMLVERGADLETLDGWHRLSPLGWATVVRWAPQFHEDRAATAAYLHEAGARLDIFTAMVMDNRDAVRTLATSDPLVLSRRLGFLDSRAQPLHLAVARRLPEMVRLLLDLAADVTTYTAWGLTPLALALASKDTATESLLRARGAVEDLSMALFAGDPAAMATQLRAGAPAGASVGDLRTQLLFFAASAGLAEPSRLLLRHGANPNAQTQHLTGERPTMMAPLHLAATHGHHAGARALLEAGAAPRQGAQDGAPTPLHLAAGGGYLETVRALLEHGADITALETGFNATPLGWAKHGKHAEIVALLHERAAG